MQEKLLSVIVPAYNLENYIEECINSIRNQTYQNLEIIIVDDGSADGTLGICQRLAKEDNRIVVLTQENAGVTKARKKGLSLAKGEYVTFADGDDYLELDMYRCMMEKVENNDMVACGIFHHVTNTQVRELFEGFQGSYHTEEQLKTVCRKMLYDFDSGKANEVNPSMCNKIFKTDLAKSIMERIRPDVFYGEDAIFVYQYLLQCQSVCFLKVPFYHYRYREGSACHSKNERMLENINKLYRELKAVFEQHEEKAVLLAQLERRTVVMAINTLNQFMGFSMKFRIPQFVIDVEDLRGADLVLYGAGQMGQDVMSMLLSQKIETVAWVDNKYKDFQEQGLEVSSPCILSEIEFDKLLIAVSSESLATEIKKELLEKGVKEDTIIWKKPIKVY